MRIGIIGMGRSGGFNLGQWIALELGYPYKHEPYINNLDTNGKNVVVKWLYSEWNDSDKNLPDMDKWIGLWRENIRECAISHAKSYQTGEWRTPYTLTTEWIEENEEYISGIQKEIQYACDILVKIPQIKLIVTYEGIYNSGKDIQRLMEYLDIKAPKYLHLFNRAGRLRDTENKPKKQLI